MAERKSGVASSEVLKQGERLLKNVGVPPRPQAVVDINFELASADPSVPEIIRIIQSDPGLSARTLKVANSPIFRTASAITTVEQAVVTLGLRNFTNLIVTSALRDVLKLGHDPINERFWAHSMLVARGAELIARRLLMVPEIINGAYLTGLFHDCAIPLMRSRYADYDNKVILALAQDLEVIHDEERSYKTNHAVVGMLFARFWGLEKSVCQAIGWHHGPIMRLTDPVARTLLAVVRFAEFISISDGSWSGLPGIPEKFVWSEMSSDVMEELKLSDVEMVDLVEDLLDKLGSL
jgi:HD-like signal output (HDOD) protein